MAPSEGQAWPPHLMDWNALLPAEQWEFWGPVLVEFQRRRLPFAIGGGLAFSAYARRWRNTKDLDLYIRQGDREAAIAAIQAAGGVDLYDRLAYDRSWIWRGTRAQAIVDIIWRMVNGRGEVDDSWLRRGPTVSIRGLDVRLLAAEELLWSKLYVLQRDRCDWPDLLSILASQGGGMDWQRLLDVVADDAGVLGGVLSVFRWLAPAEAQRLPGWLWSRVGLAQAAWPPPPADHGCRAAVLDSRPWFGPEGN